MKTKRSPKRIIFAFLATTFFGLHASPKKLPQSADRRLHLFMRIINDTKKVSVSSHLTLFDIVDYMIERNCKYTALKEYGNIHQLFYSFDKEIQQNIIDAFDLVVFEIGTG